MLLSEGPQRGIMPQHRNSNGILFFFLTQPHEAGSLIILHTNTSFDHIRSQRIRKT